MILSNIVYDVIPPNMELKEKTRKLYGKVKIALHAKKSSLATDDVINRDEIVVDLSVISRRSSVFTEGFFIILLSLLIVSLLKIFS